MWWRWRQYIGSRPFRSGVLLNRVSGIHMSSMVRWVLCLLFTKSRLTTQVGNMHFECTCELSSVSVLKNRTPKQVCCCPTLLLHNRAVKQRPMTIRVILKISGLLIHPAPVDGYHHAVLGIGRPRFVQYVDVRFRIVHVLPMVCPTGVRAGAYQSLKYACLTFRFYFVPEFAQFDGGHGLHKSVVPKRECWSISWYFVIGQ